MQKEDGRVTAHGWSLPNKYKVGLASSASLRLRHTPDKSVYALIGGERRTGGDQDQPACPGVPEASGPQRRLHEGTGVGHDRVGQSAGSGASTCLDDGAFLFCFFQLWCAAGVNLSGGRAAHPSELTKQARGSQSSLDQLEQDNKVSREAPRPAVRGGWR